MLITTNSSQWLNKREVYTSHTLEEYRNNSLSAYLTFPWSFGNQDILIFMFYQTLYVIFILKFVTLSEMGARTLATMSSLET